MNNSLNLPESKSIRGWAPQNFVVVVVCIRCGLLVVLVVLIGSEQRWNVVNHLLSVFEPHEPFYVNVLK